jgi:hypothetical protein
MEAALTPERACWRLKTNGGRRCEMRRSPPVRESDDSRWNRSMRPAPGRDRHRRTCRRTMIVAGKLGSRAARQNKTGSTLLSDKVKVEPTHQNSRGSRVA